MDRHLRREARLEKKQGIQKKKKIAQEASTTSLSSKAISPLSAPMPATDGEQVNVPFEQSSGETHTVPPHSTHEVSPSFPEDPLSAILHSLLVLSSNSNEGDDSSTIIMSLYTQHKFDVS